MHKKYQEKVVINNKVSNKYILDIDEYYGPKVPEEGFCLVLCYNKSTRICFRKYLNLLFSSLKIFLFFMLYSKFLNGN